MGLVLSSSKINLKISMLYYFCMCGAFNALTEIKFILHTTTFKHWSNIITEKAIPYSLNHYLGYNS